MSGGLDLLFPPGNSPQERTSMRLAAMERRLSDLAAGRKQAYAEAAGPFTATTTSPTRTVATTVEVLLPGPQFIDVLGSDVMASDSATSANGNATSYVTVSGPTGTDFLSVTIRGAAGAARRYYTLPFEVIQSAGTLDIASTGGVWTTWWVPQGGLHTFALVYPSLRPGPYTGPVTHSSAQLWVRY